MSAFSNNDRGLATGSSDAQRASIPSASPTTTGFVPSSNQRSVQRVTVRSGGDDAQIANQPARETGGVSAKDTSGVGRVTVSDGTAKNTSANYGSATAGGNEGLDGVRSIRSQFGSPRSGSDIRPNDIIRVGSMETTVAAAMQAGFIVKDGQGNYHDVGADKLAAEEYERQQHRAEVSTKEATVSVLNDPAAEALVNTYVSSVPATESQRVIGALINGTEIAPENLATVATLRGVEPAQVAAEIETMKTAFHEQARGYVGDKVLEHARLHDMDALRDAARQQVNTGSMEGYQRIAERHMLTLDRTDPQAIVTSEAGIKLGARIEKSTGEVSIEIPGRGRTTWGAAIRAGLIQPYFPVKRR